MEDLIYLYCITNKIPRINDVKDLADKLYFIYHQGLYALVSRVSKSEFSKENLKKNLTDLEWIKLKAKIHEEIIEGIMRYACVVPFKLATLFNTDDSLRGMLERHMEVLKENLENLEDKEEWGAKIYCDKERLKGGVGQEDGGLLRLDKEIDLSPSGKAFLLRKKKDELINIISSRKVDEYCQYAFNRLRETSLQARINRILSKEITERKEDMVLNSAFLVDKNKVSTFISAGDIIKEEYERSGFFFDCTGPWPPYNFTTIKRV